MFSYHLIIIFHFSIFVTFHSIDTTITVPLLKILFFLLSFSLSKGIILPRRERICRGLSRPWLQGLTGLVVARRSSAHHIRVCSVPVSSVRLLKVVVHLHFLLCLSCRGPVLLLTACKDCVENDPEEMDTGGNAEDCLPLPD